MLKKVENFIEYNKMLTYGDHIVVGVSGGADSVCLLDILCRISDKMHLKITAVHVNHMIRGEEADRDEEYVRKLCGKYNIELLVVKKDIPQIAVQSGESYELAGRRIRYEVFESIPKADKIAVAHHGDDQAETVLFNIFRGSSVKGAGGIRPVRGKIIRPLMCLSRKEIEQYLNVNNLEFCVDSTNADVDYTRNKMRNVLIPYIRDNINAEAVTNINRLAADLQEYYEYIWTQAKKVYEKCARYETDIYLQSEELKREPDIIRREVFMMAINDLTGSLKDITRKHILAVDELLYKDVSKKVDMPGKVEVVRLYDCVRFSKCKYMKMYDESQELKKEDFSFEILDFDGDWQKLTNDYTKVFDYDKIKDNVVLRKRLPGDFFVLDGSGKRKLLKSYFIDEKVPKELRDQIWLLAEGSHVLWIVGHRVSAEYKTSQLTKKILKVTVRRNR